jgi:hypothetical protein
VILWNGFYLFKAKENISEYIKSKLEQPQALSTSWLLELRGFRCIYLGKWKKQDENIYEKIDEKEILMHSADIISYDPATETFLAVDCTTSVPPPFEIPLIT